MMIQENISLHDKNWFNTGGSARYFCQPASESDFKKACNFANDNNLDIFVLGEGANVLINDTGFDGLVIRPALKDIIFEREEALVSAGAGVNIQNLIDTCLDNQLLGLEEFSGIPGTVGGGVYINIHYFQFLLSDFLVSARVFDCLTGEIYDVGVSWFDFGYNQSKLIDKKHYVIRATFQLKKGDQLASAYAKGRRDEIIRHRRQRYPYSNTCGSFFRNFHDDELAFKINGKKVSFVAYYLDKIGVKGQLKFGGAAVSHQHANMIVTSENATARDVIAAARKMQDLVQEQFGILPQSECQFIGFKEYPLRVK